MRPWTSPWITEGEIAPEEEITDEVADVAVAGASAEMPLSKTGEIVGDPVVEAGSECESELRRVKEAFVNEGLGDAGSELRRSLLGDELSEFSNARGECHPNAGWHTSVPLPASRGERRA